MNIIALLKKKTVVIPLLVVLGYFVLCIPTDKEKEFTPADNIPFEWKQDQLWRMLETTFLEARRQSCAQLKNRIDFGLDYIDELLQQLENAQPPVQPDDVHFIELEKELFALAPRTAACTERLPDYIKRCVTLRRVLKKISVHWDMNSSDARGRIYRLLYGSRAALEEVMLQAPPQIIQDLTIVEDVPSQTPTASILGVTIHSGDILVSRGGAPTSALISRGSDYPGNFSHIALVHVDAKTHLASIIEAHIEVGVVVGNLETYLKDKKLRVMVMRPSPDLPALKKDPLLPHKAAQFAMDDAQNRHIAYDFAMDYTNPDKLFCSEVASAAYKKFGLSLWMGISSISSKGLASWLAAFGVSHFKTQEPSDLEYDPQLHVVAEWRDRDTLYKDHLDNAVIDIMLEGAEKGERLTYKWYLLGMTRLFKGYSMLLNLFGGSGPVPEGMSAAAALKNRDFTAKHQRLTQKLRTAAQAFNIQKGYTPPYWEMIKLARESSQ